MNASEINTKIKEIIQKFQEFFKKLIINEEDKLETIKFLEKYLCNHKVTILNKAFHLVLGVNIEILTNFRLYTTMEY